MEKLKQLWPISNHDSDIRFIQPSLGRAINRTKLLKVRPHHGDIYESWNTKLLLISCKIKDKAKVYFKLLTTVRFNSGFTI